MSSCFHRCISCAILNFADDNRDSTFFPGAFCGPENPTRKHWRMELHQPHARWNWFCKLCGKFVIYIVWCSPEHHNEIHWDFLLSFNQRLIIFVLAPKSIHNVYRIRKAHILIYKNISLFGGRESAKILARYAW